MIRAIAIDDEQHCIDRLKSVLEDAETDVVLMAVCNTVDSGIEAIKEFRPELIFLDIEIHDQTGFDLLQQIHNPEFEVIFTTAFNQYALEAFEFSAIHYLLKPIALDDMNKALARFSEKHSHNDRLNKIESLLSNIDQPQKASRKLVLPSQSGLSIVESDEIVRCESDINYTTIFFANGKKTVVSKTLKEFDKMLSNYNFFRIHNSHLINLTHLKEYRKGKGGSVIMSDHSEVQVSTRRKEEFMQALRDWK